MCYHLANAVDNVQPTPLNTLNGVQMGSGIGGFGASEE